MMNNGCRDVSLSTGSTDDDGEVDMTIDKLTMEAKEVPHLNALNNMHSGQPATPNNNHSTGILSGGSPPSRPANTPYNNKVGISRLRQN